MLALTKISKSYGNAKVLRGVTLHCQSGVALCLAGANAAGKTTLLTIAAGLQKADSGTVERGGSIGFVPQDSALLGDLTLRENLMLWYAACGRRGREILSADSVERRLGLEPYMKKRVRALSGGCRKRADIACAMAKDPDYLLMDEPFTALDISSREEITGLIRELRERGKGILFSSHDPSAIAGAADRMAVLRDGAIFREEPLQEGTDRASQIMELLSAYP